MIMLRLFLILSSLLLVLPVANAQQMADAEFSVAIENPAYSRNGPRLLFDEAHNNFHTADGRYKPFADLVMNDGYRLVRNRKPFTKESLSSFKILVIANALGAEEMDDEGADRSAFTDEECAAVREWVKDGGGLLLIADHAPFGGAAQTLAKVFGVEMSNSFTHDEANAPKGESTFLIYSRENKLLGEHPINEGRDSAERINKVMTFTGQSLKGPAESVALLKLSDSAKDVSDREAKTSISAAGRAQSVALKFGKGRVVVQGEAAMLSAQVAGPEKFKMGMNVEGTDDKQFALNIVHWLSCALK
jgi:hypothetical protein